MARTVEQSEKARKVCTYSRYAQRSEVTPYLGFRHITGVMQWRPYQKARYIAQLVEDNELPFRADSAHHREAAPRPCESTTSHTR